MEYTFASIADLVFATENKIEAYRRLAAARLDLALAKAHMEDVLAYHNGLYRERLAMLADAKVEDDDEEDRTHLLSYVEWLYDERDRADRSYHRADWRISCAEEALHEARTYARQCDRELYMLLVRYREGTLVDDAYGFGWGDDYDDDYDFCDCPMCTFERFVQFDDESLEVFAEHLTLKTVHKRRQAKKRKYYKIRRQMKQGRFLP